MSVPTFKWVLETSPVDRPSDRLVLLILAWHADRDGANAYPSVETIAREARMSRRYVFEVLARLKAEGRILAEGMSPLQASGQRTVSYRIAASDAGEGVNHSSPLGVNQGVNHSAQRGEPQRTKGCTTVHPIDLKDQHMTRFVDGWYREERPVFGKTHLAAAITRLIALTRGDEEPFAYFYSSSTTTPASLSRRSRRRAAPSDPLPVRPEPSEPSGSGSSSERAPLGAPISLGCPSLWVDLVTRPTTSATGRGASPPSPDIADIGAITAEPAILALPKKVRVGPSARK